MVFIAIQHNPQGEFINHETGWVNYPYLSLLFLEWFAVVTLAASLALALVMWVMCRLRVFYRLLWTHVSG